MGIFRVYRGTKISKSVIQWNKTSYAGDKKIINKILRALNKSKYHIYEARNEI